MVVIHLQPKHEFFISRNIRHVFKNESYWENHVGGGREVCVCACITYSLITHSTHRGKITHLIGKKIQQRGLITQNMKYGRHSLEDILGSNYFPIVDFNVS